LGLALLSAFAGCGGPKAGEKVSATVAYHPSDYSGTVDKSLPPDLQAKQKALGGVFDVLLEGGRPEEIAKALPNVRFNESSRQFYDGSEQLLQWKFNGPPTGDQVPVVLTLANAGKKGQDQRKVERVYVVSSLAKGRNSPFAIVRK
jgi:hypothetical protein